MMKSKLSFLIILASALSLVSPSCSGNSDKPFPEKDNPEGEFLFSVHVDDSHTRLGSQWEGREAIGIYMLSNGTSTVLQPNARYNNSVAGNTARFLPMGEEDKLRLPEGQAVDLYAYYPYSAQTSPNGELDIDLSNQTDHKEYDLLTADNLKNISVYNHYTLNFFHRLALVEINVKNIPAEAQSMTPEVLLKSLPVEAKYHIPTNSWKEVGQEKSLSMHVEGQGESRILTAYLIPTQGNKELDCEIKLSGKSYKHRLPAITYEAGKKYSYTFKLKENPDDPTPEPDIHPYLEMPKIVKQEGFTLIFHNEPLNDSNDSPENPNVRNYTYLYDVANKMSRWVAYPLHHCYIGNYDREDKWHKDSFLPEEIQVNIKKGYSSPPKRVYDRGHQLPAADRNKNAAYSHSTMTSANCTPQWSTFNQGIWQNLEKYVRGVMNTISSAPTGYDTLYVVTGAMPEPYAGMEPSPELPVAYDNDQQEAPRPAYYYKALARRLPNGTFRTLAFCLPHKDLKGQKYEGYAISVEELEKRTGYTFFPQIPNQYKRSTQLNAWNR
ncbi:DNA/RNA non-specific endonuclease [Porphyromonas crevioricanis]|uniref:Nuclease n=1 Tax=Porphyromonas crevioricanis TaxID=393921 RepID=A0AB34PGZ8_9PORP|nr:DNA/RNA non-specific endonuclease [Porphyromonas crevioricanis]KGN95096.1 hypothetical protein HQ38_04785 [Porphyromonas crevioricanis]